MRSLNQSDCFGSEHLESVIGAACLRLIEYSLYSIIDHFPSIQLSSPFIRNGIFSNNRSVGHVYKTKHIRYVRKIHHNKVSRQVQVYSHWMAFRYIRTRSALVAALPMKQQLTAHKTHQTSQLGVIVKLIRNEQNVNDAMRQDTHEMIRTRRLPFGTANKWIVPASANRSHDL